MLHYENKNPKVSIGFPVYNGEQTLKKSLDSLLSQTFTNFELIISDNASTDMTSEICKEYSKKDKRISYFGQKNNIGAYRNFYFVLENAKNEYFMWAAADDTWEPTFLEKNIQVLESNSNMVGSISNVKFFGKDASRYEGKNPTRTSSKYRYVRSITGTYEEKFSFYFKFMQSTMVYAVFRTNSLKKSIGSFRIPWDLSIILSVLKYGDLYVVDDILLHRHVGGHSQSNLIKSLQNEGFSRLEIAFMFVPFMKWCKELFGTKFILKNLPTFIHLHYRGYSRILLDQIRQLKKEI